MKYKRYNVNAPLDLVEMIEHRIREIGYKSPSDYFMGLAIFDCWCRRHHKYTANLMAMPPEVRDKAFMEIAEKYKAGEQKTADPGWFDKFVARVVKQELAKAGLPAA